MKIWHIFKAFFAGTILGNMAFAGTGSLPGRVRVRNLPAGIYDVADLNKEFSHNPLPNNIVNSFQQAVLAQKDNRGQDALHIYFSLDNISWNNGYINLAEGSAVVTYNIALIYDQAGQKDVARTYFTAHKRLQSEAKK